MGKNVYRGYKRKIPENIKVIPVEKLMKEGDGPYGRQWKETRYVIIDADTGEVFDDAQGYGYKTKQKAYAAFNYKNRPEDEFRHDEEVRQKVREYCKNHKSVLSDIEVFMFDELKCGNKVTAEQLSDFLSEDVKAEMGFSVRELMKYW